MVMKFTAYFSRQARKPSGLFGRFYMSRLFEKGNIDLNTLVYDHLAVRDNDRLLEIGFGTGKLINKITTHNEKSIVEGVDFSKTMVSMAKKKNKKKIKTGKVKIHQGDFDQITYEDNSFDKIFTVNTIYFWPDPQKTIAKIIRVLKPGGKVLVGFLDKKDMMKMPLSTDVFEYYSDQDVTGLLAGYVSKHQIKTISGGGEKGTYHCVIATKPE